VAPPVPIPADVRDWLRSVFAGCNEQVSGTMTRMATIHEVPLDMTFIQHFLSVSAPRRFDSGWTAEISTHYLGGGRHFGEWPDWPRRWEIADIGMLVVFRQGGQVLRSKVALLQSKRLYPIEQEWHEDIPPDYAVGFARLFHDDDDWAAVTESRRFSFTEESQYRALLTGAPQYNAIASYEQANDIPVYYLLYNPWKLPSSVVVPLVGDVELTGPCEVGCRVVPARQLHNMLAGQAPGYSPAYRDLHGSLGEPFTPAAHPAGWRLEHFVTDLLLECHTGYIAESRVDRGLNYIFNRRSGPIAAAIAVTLDAP
jgi:hypothetical protein